MKYKWNTNVIQVKYKCNTNALQNQNWWIQSVAIKGNQGNKFCFQWVSHLWEIYGKVQTGKDKIFFKSKTVAKIWKYGYFQERIKTKTTKAGQYWEQTNKVDMCCVSNVLVTNLQIFFTNRYFRFSWKNIKKNMKVHLMHLFTVKCKMECPWGANESVRHKGSHYYCTQDVRRHVNWTLKKMTTIMMMMLTIPQIVWQNNWIIFEPACLWESWDRN